jgi:hypothetical protein
MRVYEEKEVQLHSVLIPAHGVGNQFHGRAALLSGKFPSATYIGNVIDKTW